MEYVILKLSRELVKKCNERPHDQDDPRATLSLADMTSGRF